MQKIQIFDIFWPTQKMGPDGPKWGQEDFFPTNPDLANILGRTDLDFVNFIFFHFFGSQISGFPGSQIFKIWPGPGLGLGPGLGPRVGQWEIWERAHVIL